MNSFVVVVDGRSFDVSIHSDGSGMINGDPVSFELSHRDPGLTEIILEGKAYRFPFQVSRGIYEILHKGVLYEVKVVSEREAMMEKLSHAVDESHKRIEITAPMPALVFKVMVARGDRVQTGQPLVVLEAMKMENEIKAARGGVVGDVLINPGAAVEKGELLLTIE